MDGEVSHKKRGNRLASDQILVEREATHGCFGDVAKTSQALNAVLRRGAHWDALSDRQREALQMISTKLSRVVNGDPGHRDHWADIAGYAELAQDRASGAHSSEWQEKQRRRNEAPPAWSKLTR